jgi:tRNA (adenine37-N6)-methyltransferase
MGIWISKGSKNMTNSYTFQPIGRIHSCYSEKFGIPRQSGLVPEVPAVLEIFSPFDQDEALRGLDGFSHLWLLFVFHQCMGQPWRATVRPPRLGGNARIGVFASRSGFRPNPIGQSAVRLISVTREKSGLHLHLKGVDLLDGTPVLDIKPYILYADSIPDARSGYAQAAPAPELDVVFSPEAQSVCRSLEQRGYPELKSLIIAHLLQDPRPAYQRSGGQRSYGMRLWDLNVRFRIDHDTAWVESLDRVADG